MLWCFMAWKSLRKERMDSRFKKLLKEELPEIFDLAINKQTLMF